MTERVEIIDNQFVCAGKVYGPATAVLAYPGEDEHLGSVDGVIRCKTPHNIDLVLAIGDRVAGLEVKIAADLAGSWRSRRLQRQLRTLRDVVDIPGLVVPGGFDVKKINESLRVHKRALFWEDLTSLQTLGVYLLPVPRFGYLPYIYQFRRALTTNGYRALAGDDRVQRERAPGWLLRRIPGIGLQKSHHLIDMYGSVFDVFHAARNGGVSETHGQSVQDKILKALEE